jgi:hypothetical protein
MEKIAVKKFIQKKLNIPITPENVYTSIGKHNDNAIADANAHANTDTHTHAKKAKYLDELYSATFTDDYFS